MVELSTGHSLDDAVDIAIKDLADLKSGDRGGVVIHAIDKDDQHRVVNFRCEGDIRYWYWSSDLSKPELRDAEIAEQ